MSVVLPVAQIAREHAAGAKIAALAKRYRVSGPTILSRLRLHTGRPAWPRRKLEGVRNPERFWAARMGDRRFDAPISKVEAAQLRRLAGWGSE